jgi:hypothetical protein
MQISVYSYVYACFVPVLPRVVQDQAEHHVGHERASRVCIPGDMHARMRALIYARSDMYTQWCVMGHVYVFMHTFHVRVFTAYLNDSDSI